MIQELATYENYSGLLMLPFRSDLLMFPVELLSKFDN